MLRQPDGIAAVGATEIERSPRSEARGHGSHHLIGRARPNASVLAIPLLPEPLSSIAILMIFRNSRLQFCGVKVSGIAGECGRRREDQRSVGSHASDDAVGDGPRDAVTTARDVASSKDTGHGRLVDGIDGVFLLMSSKSWLLDTLRAKRLRP